MNVLCGAFQEQRSDIDRRVARRVGVADGAARRAAGGRRAAVAGAGSGGLRAALLTPEPAPRRRAHLPRRLAQSASTHFIRGLRAEGTLRPNGKPLR